MNIRPPLAELKETRSHMSRAILRKPIIRSIVSAFCAVTLFSSASHAVDPMVSPAGGALPAEITTTGGLVIDLVGLNGTRIVTEIPPVLLLADYSSGVGTATIGIATGFTSTLLNALGGGLSSAAFRITLYGGDNAPGDYWYGTDSLFVNNIPAGNFSTVSTVQTSGTGGSIIIGTSTGFPGSSGTATGFFTITGSTSLSSLYTSLLTTGSMQFLLATTTSGNYLDFSYGATYDDSRIGYIAGIGAPTRVIDNGGALQTPYWIDYTAFGKTVTAGVSSTIGSLTFNPGGEFAISGELKVDYGRIYSTAGGSSLLSGGVLNGDGSTLIFILQGKVIVTSTIANALYVEKYGPETLILAGENTYTGYTDVIGGTLQIGDGSGGSVNTSKGISVSSTAALAINMANNATMSVNVYNDGIVRTIGANTNILSGDIMGEGAFDQHGSGLTILTGSNTYWGDTTVSSGTLQIGDGANGTISSYSRVSVAQGGTLVLNSSDTDLLSHSISNDGTFVLLQTPFSTSYTFTGEISGAGAVVKKGSNTLILDGSNSYTGATIVSGGTMTIASADALPSQTALQVDSGATIDLSSFSKTVGSLSGYGSVLIGSGTVLTVGANNANAYFAGSISGDADVEKIGTGLWVLGGANTYTGITTITGGTLQIGDGNAGSLTSSSIVVGPVGSLAFNMGNNAEFSIDVVNNGNIQAIGPNTNIISSVISGNGGFEQRGYGNTILSGTNTYFGDTVVSSGTLQIGDGSKGTVSNSNFVINSGGTLVLNSPDTTLLEKSILNNGMFVLREDPLDSYEYSGGIAGNGSLMKSGTNTLVLSGSNSYGGATIVTGGILLVTSEHALPSTTALHVTSGGTADLSKVSQSVGSLSGDASVITGSNTVFTVGSNNTNATFSGVIIGSGTLQKVGSGIWNLTGENTYTGPTNLHGGTMLVNGSIQSDLSVMAGILGGSGIIHGNVMNNAVVSPGNSPGTLTVNGNYTQSSTGSLLIQIASKTSYDRLAVGGTASLDGALLASIGTYKLRGTRFIILTADGGVNGTFSDVSSASLLRLNVIYEPNDVVLESSYRNFSKLSGMTANASAVAKVIDKLIDTESFYYNDRLLNTVDNLNDLSDKSLRSALDTIAPSDYILLPDAGFSMAQTQASNLERRMEEIRNTLVDFTANTSAPSTFYNANARTQQSGIRFIDPTGRELAPTPIEPRWGFFLNGSGEYVSDKCSVADDNQDGKFNTGGISMGADYRFNDNFAAGLTAGYANTTTTGRGDGNVGIDSGDISAYATAFNQGFFVNGVLGGASNNYSVKRESFGGLTHADTSGSAFHALLGGGYTYICEGLSAGPIASLRYTTVKIDGFRESGSLAPLDIASQSKSSVKTTLGFQAAYEIPVESIIVRPLAKIQWLHEYSNDDRSIDAGFVWGGDSFTVNGPTLGSDSFLIDIGASVMINPTVSVYSYYSGQIGATNYTSNTIFGGVQLNF